MLLTAVFHAARLECDVGVSRLRGMKFPATTEWRQTGRLMGGQMAETVRQQRGEGSFVCLPFAVFLQKKSLRKADTPGLQIFPQTEKLAWS